MLERQSYIQGIAHHPSYSSPRPTRLWITNRKSETDWHGQPGEAMNHKFWRTIRRHQGKSPKHQKALSGKVINTEDPSFSPKPNVPTSALWLMPCQWTQGLNNRFLCKECQNDSHREDSRGKTCWRLECTGLPLNVQWISQASGTLSPAFSIQTGIFGLERDTHHSSLRSSQISPSQKNSKIPSKSSPRIPREGKIQPEKFAPIKNNSSVWNHHSVHRRLGGNLGCQISFSFPGLPPYAHTIHTSPKLSHFPLPELRKPSVSQTIPPPPPPPQQEVTFWREVRLDLSRCIIHILPRNVIRYLIIAVESMSCIYWFMLKKNKN